jgi:hypothetical protein
MKPNEIGRLARERIDVPWDDIRAARVQRAVLAELRSDAARATNRQRSPHRVALLVAIAACLAAIGLWRARPWLGAASRVDRADGSVILPERTTAIDGSGPRPGLRSSAVAPGLAVPKAADPSAGDGDTVTFVKNKATGPLAGHGWISGGSGLTVTSPTCQGGAFTFQGGTGCTKTVWSSPTELCMTGSNTAVCSQAGAPCDSTNNWGAEIGVDVGSPRGLPLGGAYRTVSLTFTGEPPYGARLQVIDGQGSAYCADGYTSGTAVTAADLTTSCWSATAARTPLPSLSAIVAIELRIKSGRTAETIADVCVTRIDLR